MNKYSCVILYNFSNSTNNISSFFFRSLELPEHAPVVYEELSDVTGYEGSRTEMSCKVIGKPTPTITW